MLLPPNELSILRSQSRNSIVRVHQHVDKTVQQPHQHEVVCRMMHQMQPGPRHHGGVVVQMEEGDLVVLLAEDKKYRIEKVQVLRDEVRVNFSYDLQCDDGR